MDTMGFIWGSIGRQLFVVEKVRISGPDYEMEVDFICQTARLRTLVIYKEGLMVKRLFRVNRKSRIYVKPLITGRNCQYPPQGW